jgi:hypothetical protein
MKKLLFALLLPFAGFSKNKLTTVLPTDIYYEFPKSGIPVIIDKGTPIKMTCTGFQIPRAEPVQIRFNGWSGVENKNHPLLIINDCEADYSTIKYLSPNRIEKIDVFVPNKAVEKYGEKAQYGAIIIKLKTNTINEPAKAAIVKPIPTL